MNPEGLRRISMELVTNFTSFAPLGHRAGRVARRRCGRALGSPGGRHPRCWCSARRKQPAHGMVVVFAAVVSNTASEMGYVVLIPLAAVVFHAVGRNPLVGSGGRLRGGVRRLLGQHPDRDGRPAALRASRPRRPGLIDPSYAPGEANEVLPTANYYFMVASTFLITAVGTLVTTRRSSSRSWGPTIRAAVRTGIEEATAGDGRAVARGEARPAPRAGLTIGVMTLGPPGSWPCPRTAGSATPAENETLVQDLRPMLKKRRRADLRVLHRSPPSCTGASPAR